MHPLQTVHPKEKLLKMDIVGVWITVFQPVIVKNSKNIALQNISLKHCTIMLRDNFVVHNQ